MWLLPVLISGPYWFWARRNTEYMLSNRTLELRTGGWSATIDLAEIRGVRRASILSKLSPTCNSTYASWRNGALLLLPFGEIYLTPNDPERFIAALRAHIAANSSAASDGNPAEI